jgi:hypothetical protein
MMDGPGRVKNGIKIQGAELYPHPNAGLTGMPGAELHSAAKPEKLHGDNISLDTLYS